MKKSSLLKFIKITGVVTGLAFLSIMIWANWEPKGYTQIYVSDSQFITFDISELKSGDQTINIEKEISSIDGVSSCSYNSLKKFVGVIFYTSQMTSTQLQDKIKGQLGVKVTETEIPQVKTGCPVGGVRYFIMHVKHVLNFRS
ncbi:MAG: hypothetical protein V4580_16150 [Bacteroidota bacterium]